MKLYGSLDNRLDEGKNFTGREIKEGDDITMYYWSDRTCYYVTRVIDQKHIFVRKYQVCADRSKPGGMGHQNWLYFKTNKEKQAYFNKCIEEGTLDKSCYHSLDDIYEDKEEEWVFRYGYWRQVLSDKRYYKLSPISFGVREYYYDWEF